MSEDETPASDQPETGEPKMRTLRDDQISVATLKRMAQGMFGNIVKAVVDVDLGIMVVDMEMHADAEALLIDNGSRQRALWGINLHPESFGSAEFVEFDSMINMRPRQGNNSKYVEDAGERAKVLAIVERLVKQ